jgi:hypothetical protein
VTRRVAMQQTWSDDRYIITSYRNINHITWSLLTSDSPQTRSQSKQCSANLAVKYQLTIHNYKESPRQEALNITILATHRCRLHPRCLNAIVVETHNARKYVSFPFS